MIDLTAGVLAGAFAIVLLSGVVLAVTGFGANLVAVPLLTFLIGPAPAVIVAITIGLVSTAGVAVVERKHVSRTDVIVLFVASLVGIPLGMLALTGFDERQLTLVVALVLLGSTAAISRGWVMPSGRVTRWLAGLISGVLLTSTSLNGPPLVLFLQARNLSPRTVRASLAAVFFLANLIAVPLLVGVGAVDLSVLVISAVGQPALAVGWLIGNRMFTLLDPLAFRRIVLFMLALTGIVALARVATG